jgi:hypothetical protein
LSGNQSGPRQFEFPPNIAVVDSAGSNSRAQSFSRRSRPTIAISIRWSMTVAARTGMTPTMDRALTGTAVPSGVRSLS